MNKDIIVGLDIGTTKIACIIGELDVNRELKLIGVGVSPSNGLRKGVVVNIDKTVQSISQAVEEAELMAGVDVEEVYVGIAGDHIRSINSKGVIAVSRAGNEITHADVERVIDAAKAVAIPMDREILHVIPQEFIVDEQTGIHEPVGMSGVRLEAEVHIVTGAVTSAQNIYKSVEKAGLKVRDIVLQPLASSYSVLDDDEKELGVALVDMGGGTSDLAIFYDDGIRHTGVISLGGRNVTSDVAIGIRTPLEKAEEIKRNYGSTLASKARADEYIPVPGVGGRESREISKSVLASIIEPRMEEIYCLVLREIKRTGYSGMLGAGIVITGGCALMPGAAELAEQVFQMPVRVGIPTGFGGLAETAKSPVHATGVGLVHYGARHGGESKGIGAFGGDDHFSKIFGKMKEWIKEFF